MALPARRYFTLSEIADRWGTTVTDLGTYAVEGLLQLCVMALAKRVSIAVAVEAHDAGPPEELREEVLNGPQPILAVDVWPIVQNRVGAITRFKPPRPDHDIELAPGVEPIKVTLSQLLMTRDERNRVEAEYDIAVREAGPVRATPGFEHNADYSEVSVGRRRYKLGRLQAKVVQELHQASLNGEPWLKNEELLSACGAKSARLVDLFKNQPEWRELVRQDNKGSCRLNLADRAPSQARQSAFRRAVTAHRRPGPIGDCG